MRDNDEFEQLLDAALVSYGDHEPAHDLDQRILAGVSAETTIRPRHRWTPWAIALPLAACLLFAAGLYETSRPGTPKQAGNITAVARSSAAATSIFPARPAMSAPTRSPSEGVNTRIGRDVRRPIVATQEAPPNSLPRLEVFPTPQPVSAAEEALLNYTPRAPALERNSLPDAQKQAAAPITIAAIHIPPLEPPDKGAN